MPLKAIVIGDPDPHLAQLIARECEPLAQQRIVATSGTSLLDQVRQHTPELLVLSHELTGPAPQELLPELTHHIAPPRIFMTYRELSIPEMERLGRAGVCEFLPHPVDITDLYRTASRVFGQHFRRHTRYPVHLDVLRADGVSLGRTHDVSEGGLRMAPHVPLQVNDSFLIQLRLPDGQSIQTRCRFLGTDPSEPAVVRGQFEKMHGDAQRRLITYLSTLR